MSGIDSQVVTRQGFSKFLCVLAVSSVLALGACGGGGGGGGDGDSGSPSNSNLPADPGDAGKVTIGGVDSDNDGVRDDIEIAVSTLNLSTEEKTAALQVAKGVQDAIQAGLDGTSADSQRNAAIAMAMAVDCVSHRFGSDAANQIALMELFALNTPERAAAYEQFNAATVGQQFGDMESEEVACE